MTAPTTIAMAITITTMSSNSVKPRSRAGDATRPARGPVMVETGALASRPG